MRASGIPRPPRSSGRRSPLRKLSITPVAIDVDDAGSVTRGIDEVLARAGRIDALVNNAGIGGGGPIEDVPVDWAVTTDAPTAVPEPDRGTFELTAESETTVPFKVRVDCPAGSTIKVDGGTVASPVALAPGRHTWVITGRFTP